MEVATRRREQEVWQACDDLWALYGDMKHVTGDGIRERLITLGKSRGSPNELYKYRKTWVTSRGLDVPRHDGGDDLLNSDPITRAVRIVHDQLRDSTESRIDAITAEYAEKLAAKELEYAELKRSLDNVLTEYGLLEQKLSHAAREEKTLAAQLQAEIDIRRALERELQLEKSLHHADNQRALADAGTAKQNFVDEIERLNNAAAVHQSAYEKHVRELTERMHALGHEYSESLMTVKTSLLNHEITAKLTAEKYAEAVERLQRKNGDVVALEKVLAQATAREAELTVQRQSLVAELAIARTERVTVEQRHERRNVKANVTIARLRAVIEHRPRSAAQ